MNKFTNYTDITIPKCNKCKWYLGYGKCQAFKNGIEKNILLGKKEHNKIIEGQKGDYVYTSYKSKSD